ETALVRDSGENVALARRRQIFDRAALRDRVEIVTVARERECAVGEREYEAAMADRVTVHHVAAYRHRERSPARLDLHDRHAQRARRAVACEHALRNAPRERKS